MASNPVTVSGDLIAGDKVLGNKTVGLSAEEVAGLLARISQEFQPRPFEGRCPYVGLAAFGEQDADLFFGREALVADLLARVRTSRFIVVAGPSGSGKSSLVRAGLLPVLRRGASRFPAIAAQVIPRSDAWLYAVLKPGREPLDALARAIETLAANLQAGDDLRSRGKTDPAVLARWADIALGDDQRRRAVLVIDQFEELFTQSSSEEERVAFLDLLTRSASIEGGRLCALITLRSDFISECATYPHLNALLSLQFAQVGPMRPEELVSAIALPALQVGLRVDPDLIAQVVADMRDEPGALPLMQFALKDLFDAQQARGGVIALTLADYLARGGVRGSLARHADGILGSLPPPEQELARAVFSGLVQVKPGAQPARRTAALGELAPAGAADARAVIRKLADGRLISTDEQGGQDFVTLAHERLIESWPWLSRLIEENREAIAIRNQIGDDAAQWLARGRDPGYVYTGGRLDYARDRLAKINAPLRAPLSAPAAEFLAAGDREEARRRRARYLGQAAGGAVGAGIGYGAYFALSVAFAHANAGQNASLMTRVSLVTFLALAPIGALVGLCAGLGLYRWRSPAGASRGAPSGARQDMRSDLRRHARRGLGAGAAGALAGSIAQVLAQLATGAAAGTGAVLIDPVETGIGALFGLSVGLGAGLFSERRWRLMFTPAFTLGAAALAELAALAAAGGLTRHPAVTLIAGLLLGVFAALGFVVTSVEE